jgi:L-aspartate oxidase
MHHVPFSCRDNSYHVDLAIAAEQRKGRKVYWRKNGSAHPVNVTHFAHAFNGGVKINENAETGIPGLFAAGEVAAGPHGADRIGGCMMTATQVFGARAGWNAVKFAKKHNQPPEIKRMPETIKLIASARTRRTNTKPIKNLMAPLKQKFSQALMLHRDREGIESYLTQRSETTAAINAFEASNSITCLKAKNIILVMKLIATATLNQHVSLGSHYRSDPTPHPPIYHQE